LKPKGLPMRIEAKCQIASPKSDVFNTFSNLNDLADSVQAITKIELLTTGEIGVGTKFKESRVMFGKESDEVMEITHFSPHSHFREEAHSNGVHYISDWNFEESDNQTTVTVTFRAQAQILVAKLMGLLLFLMASSMKKAFVTDMNDLKRILEAKN